jgi:predicted transposase/invertase (TIGR01784 family)
LDPKLDIVFWMLFGAEQNRALLMSLLNAVLQPPVPIASAEVLHAQPERVGVDDKSIALDVRVRLENGEQVDVEMQSQRRPAQRERALYYWARLYAGQLQRGETYAELRRCVVILITNFNELADSRFHSRFGVQEARSAAPLTDHLELHVLELPKLREAFQKNDEPSLVAWGRFLVATADDDLETLAMENPVLKQAKDALERLSADPEARLRAEQREMALLSYELDVAKARREGTEKGRAEGIEKGRAEGIEKGRAEGIEKGRAEGMAALLTTLLALKFGPLPSAVTARLTSASDAELVSWSERVLMAQSLEHVFRGP